jgi:nucleotide-binding universal stress UspA family protein
MFDRILIASDGSDGSGRALGAAIALARVHNADLHMISVEELSRFPASVDEVVEEQLEANHRYDAVVAKAKAQARAEGVSLTAHVVIGHAVPAIVEFVERERFDVLVVGFMGHSALYNRLIGSTTDRLVELAPCAVLVVK